jgi:hypothetical protein
MSENGSFVGTGNIRSTMSNSLGEHDQNFAAIEAAVKETARGRAFLADYAKKIRQSDILTMLALIARLEQWSRDQDIRLAEFGGRNPAFGNQRPEVRDGLPMGAPGRSTEQTTECEEALRRSHASDVLTMPALDQDLASTSKKSNDAASEMIANCEAKDRIEGLAKALCDRDQRIADLTNRHWANDKFTDERRSTLIASADDRTEEALSHSVTSHPTDKFLRGTAVKAHAAEEDILDGIAKALATAG